MSHNVSLFGLSYIIAICVLAFMGSWTLALMAMFILFVGLRICGH